MNVSIIKAFVWILPNTDLVSRDYRYLDQLTKRQLFEGKEDEITLEGEIENLPKPTWKVDACILDDGYNNNKSPDEEIERAVRLVLEGFNSACLFFNVGGGMYTYQKRMEVKQQIIKEFEGAIKPNTKIEYVYLGITDLDCCDLRKDTFQTRDSVLDKGIDHWMIQVNNISDIWKELSKGSKLPYVVKIRLTDNVTKKPGCFYLFDLLSPRFLPPTLLPDAAEQKIYYSFATLRSIVGDVIDSSSKRKDKIIPINDNVLTRLLAPFVSGAGRLTIFSHLNKYPKGYRAETIMALDFIKALRGIRSVSFPNNVVVEKRDGRQTKTEKEYHKLQQLLTSKNDEVCQLKLEKERLKQSQSINENKFKKNKDELQNQITRLQAISNQYKANAWQTATTRDREMKATNMELEKKLNWMSKELTKRNKHLSQVKQIFKRSAEEVGYMIKKSQQTRIFDIDILNKKRMKEKEHYESLLKRLMQQNSQLRNKVKDTEAQLVAEMEIARAEKTEMRAFVKALRESALNNEE